MIVVTGLSAFSQLTGTKTIPGNYPTVAAAIAALNSSGAGPGGVTFNVASGYTETFPSATSGLITTQTGSQTNPIVFQKTGSGANPLITAANGKGMTDGIITVAGCDYITFDGIDLKDNPVNSGSDEWFEWGYAILKESASNGSQFVTIRNCNVSMTFYYENSVGIYSGNHIAQSSVQLTVTAQSGTNSRLRIYSNTLNDSYSGISLNGYNDPNAPYDFYDQDNQVGKDGANIITNVAGQDTYAGYGIYTRYQNNLKVANNHITSYNGGSGAPYGIYLTSATNASYDLYNNFVSLQYTGDGATSFNPIYCDMGAFGTSNIVNIYNNTVSGCGFSTATTGISNMMYLTNLGVTTTIYGNNVTDNTIGDYSVTATGRINYLYCNKNNTGYGPVDVHDNTVSGNQRFQMTPGAGQTYCLSVTGKGTSMNFYNNIVSNNSIQSNSGTYLMNVSLDVADRNVHDNTVSAITNAEGTVYGIYNYNVTANSGIGYFYRNKVTNIESQTSNSTIYGLYSTAIGSTTYYYNNIFSDLRPTKATSTYGSLYGIYLNQGNGVMYNNTVFISAASTGTNFSSAAFYSANTGNVPDLRNNIFVNNSTPSGAGKTVAIRFNDPNLTYFAATSNYNDYYAGVPSSTHLIYYDGTNSDQTLAAYQARVFPREVQSVTELPPFMDSNPTTTDVHIRVTQPTQCESGGSIISTPVNITADYDGNPRYPNIGYPYGTFMPGAPDIGADEFGGLSYDITPPSITYTPLNNTMNGSARTLVVTIKDGSGIPHSGTGLPMLYWKINSGTWQAVQSSFVSGNEFSFTFGGGTVTGDIVSYYVVAQDQATTPNVIAKPSQGASGYSINPPACLAPPSTPSSYSIQLPISGTFHVGIGKYYVRLTDAAADINSKVLAGPVILILDDNSYPSEVYPVTFNSNPGSSSVNTITIKPGTGVVPGFFASSGTGLLNLSGIDYLTIDGSNNGTSTKNITIENSSSTGTSCAVLFSNYGGSDPATNITIKNCILKCQPASGYSGSTTILCSATGGGYRNLTLDNNTICGAFTGVILQGTSGNVAHNCRIINNIIGSAAENEFISDIGVYTYYADSTLVENNEIMGPRTGSLNIGQTGVYIGSNSTNSMIKRNKIHDFYHNSDDGWGVSGIWYSAESSSVTEISDNVIYDIKSPGMNPGVGMNIVYGIFLRSGGNIKILHNTVNLTGAWLSSTYDASSACIGIYYQVTGNNIEIRNNLFKNSMTCTGTPNILGRAYGIMISAAANLFTIIDNNDYFIDGYNGSIGQQYTQGYGYIVNFPTLASWQAYTGQEANSVTIDPIFPLSGNLIPTSASLNNKGFYLPNVPVDITGKLRNNPSDIGAYEFGNDPFVTTVAASPVTSSSATLNGTVNPSTGSVSTFFDYGYDASYGNTVTAIPQQISGTGTYPFSALVPGLTANVTYHFRARTISLSGQTCYGADMTFTTVCQAAGAAGAISGPTVVYPGQSGVTYSVASIANATGYAWSVPTGVNITAGSNTSSITVDFTLSAVSGNITVYGTSSCGNGTISPSFALTVIPLNTTVTGTTGSGSTNCFNAAATLTVAGNGTTYQLMSGGSADFIAGQKISFLPGTTLLAGSHAHAWITSNGQFCTNPTNPLVNTGDNEPVHTEAGLVQETGQTENNSGDVVRVFPNPASAFVNIEIPGNSPDSKVSAEIIGLNGDVFRSISFQDNLKMTIQIDNLKPGLYFLKIGYGNTTATRKLIKL